MAYDPNAVLTEPELAEWLKISVSTLRHKRSNRQGIPFLRFGRTVRYRVRDVLDYLDQVLVKVNSNSQPPPGDG